MIPLGNRDKLYETTEFVNLNEYFISFKENLFNFINEFISVLTKLLSGCLMAADADLDKPLSIRFMRDGANEVFIIDPETNELVEDGNYYELKELFSGGYEKVKRKLGICTNIPSSGTIDPSLEEEQNYYFY